MKTLSMVFQEVAHEIMAFSKSPTVVTEDNVYQEFNPNIRPYVDGMIPPLLLPGSGLDGLENLEDLYEKALSGKSCLLLLEHYSNMDLPLFTYLVEKAGGKGSEIVRSVVAIAGTKLNESDPMVSAFTSAYTRIVIYPSRSLQGLDPENEKDRAEIARSNAINRAAMKALTEIKTSGRLILLFPSGTRYRPGDPSTKRGVREIDSYIKSFDYMCMVAINGLVLHVNPNNMLDDEVTKDVVRIKAGPVISCAEFRNKIRAGIDASSDPDADKKQAVADAIMAELEKMHTADEEKRREFLAKITPF